MIIIEGKIKAKARPRFNTKTGRAFTPNDTVSYEKMVRHCYMQQCGEYLNGAVRATIYMYFKIPKSYTKKRVAAIREGLEYPMKTPDVDNCSKIILDSLNKVAYDDDQQVVELSVIKRWTEEEERIEFLLEEIKLG